MLGKKSMKKSNSDYGRVILEGRWLLKKLKSGVFKLRNEMASKVLPFADNTSQFSSSLNVQKMEEGKTRCHGEKH